jgi:Tfp pilus assembly protein FimV
LNLPLLALETGNFMNPINKDELYEHLSGFLKARGIQLSDGSYKSAVQTSCNLLTEAINLGQEGVQRAKSEVEKQLDQMRQVIHQKTAPKAPTNPPVAAAPPRGAAPKAAAPKAAKPKKGKSGKGSSRRR